MLKKFYQHLHSRLCHLCSLPLLSRMTNGSILLAKHLLPEPVWCCERGKRKSWLRAVMKYMQQRLVSVMLLHLHPLSPQVTNDTGQENHYIIRTVSNWLYSGCSFWPKIYRSDKKCHSKCMLKLRLHICKVLGSMLRFLQLPWVKERWVKIWLNTLYIFKPENTPNTCFDLFCICFLKCFCCWIILAEMLETISKVLIC